MTKPISRRKALASIASAATLLKAADSSIIQIAAKPVEISLIPATPRTVRISVTPVDSGGAVPSDGSLVKDNWGAPAARVRSLARAKSVRCGELTVKLSSSPLTIRVEAKDGTLVQQLRIDQETGAVSFALGDTPLLGLGAGGPQFDRRGSTDRMRSGQGGYQLRTHGGRVPIPWLIGTSGWAMFIHHPFGTFDFTGKEGKFLPAGPQSALPLDVFVVGAREPAAILGEYAKLTGYPEMVPLWSFGYQQSHRTLGTPEEIIREAKMFRGKKLPCDMMIYLGTDFCPNGWNTHNGEFTWNPAAFPDPKRAIQELHDEHFKVVLHIVVEGRRFIGKVSDPCTA